MKRLLKLFKANKSETTNTSKKQSRITSSNNSLLEKLFTYDTSGLILELDDEAVEKVLNDLTVIQSDESRKAVTEKKELTIISSNQTYVELFEELFNPELISQILDTYMYGFNVFEVNWEQRNGLWVPLLVQRDYRAFVYDEHEVLKFKKQGTLYDIDDYKVITATYRRRFNKPYGNAVVNKIYFPVKLKNASLAFWVHFLEKFGSPWAIGKTDSDVDNMADEINAMLSGDTAVIDPDETIELVHPDGGRGDFDKLIEYCDSQVNRAILGGNLTGNVTAGSLAATKVHNDIREDLAAADKKILEYVLNRAIAYFKAINNISEEIKLQLFDEDDPRIELSSRDKTIYDMGYRPTKEYIETTYNITVEEIQPQIIENKTPFKNRLIANNTADKEEQEAINKTVKFEELVESFIKNTNLGSSNFMELLENAESYEDILNSLSSLKNVEPQTIQDAILISELYGMSNDV